MKRDNRLYIDLDDGRILFSTSEAEGETLLPHKENQRIGYVDVPFGSIDPLTTVIVGVDPETKELITETVDNRTEEQKRIEELEEQLLLLSGVI